jgi:hypothetical protein
MYSMLSLGKYPSKIHRVRASIPAHRARAVLLFFGLLPTRFVQTLKVPLGVLIGIILMPPVAGRPV